MSASLAGKPAPRAKLAGAAVATAIAFAILVALGLWQLQRLRWKEGLLAQIDAAERAPPRPLTNDTPPLFTRVTVHGTLRGDPIGLYGAEVQNEHLGARLVQILDRDGAPPLVVVLGWVATDHGKPKGTAGLTDVLGYVRLPETANWLSAADDQEGRRFYTLNPAAIAPALGAPSFAPFALMALGAGDTLPRPVNNHLQYALTWFGLAVALLGVFFAWARGRR